MHPVFNDSALQSEFDPLGYIVVDFWDKDTVTKLTDFYYTSRALKPSISGITYEMTYFFEDTVYKKKVRDELLKHFIRPVNTILKNYRPEVLNFINKEKGAGRFDLHQNWKHVDEDHFTSVSVWVPLVDIADESGGIEFVKGSHNLFKHILRGPNIPGAFTSCEKQLKANHLTKVNVKAGQALIFDDSIIHFSGINNTNADRLVAHAICIPVQAKSMHYYQKSNFFFTRYYKLEVQSDFFLNNDYENLKNFDKIEQVKYKFKKINYPEFKRIYLNKPA